MHIFPLRCGGVTDTRPNRHNPDSDTCSKTLRYLRPIMLSAGSMNIVAIYRHLPQRPDGPFNIWIQRPFLNYHAAEYI
jgi:hypothetical protein